MCTTVVCTYAAKTNKKQMFWLICKLVLCSLFVYLTQLSKDKKIKKIKNYIRN